mmetsp:Transcript_10755/g.29150  ORF Transcript_10755/g.29150 Transcript_10755/m.29150 type:complete len:323 (-) Transcript_10755:1006-1974(-)
MAHAPTPIIAGVGNRERRWPMPIAIPMANGNGGSAPSSIIRRSVVEETHARVSHDHAVLVGGLGDALVLHGAAGVHEVLDTKAGCHINVVAEREECIRGDADVLEVGLQELLLLRICEGLNEGGEVALPFLELRSREVALDVLDARVDAVLALDALLEGEAEHLGVLAQCPRVCLAAGELDTIDTALLACPHTDHLAALGVADGVGLRVLDADLSEHEVARRAGGELLVLGHDLGEGGGSIELGVVATLLEARTPHLAALQKGGLEVGLGLEDDEGALLLALEDLEGRWLVVWRDDAVGDLGLEELRGLHVHRVREGGEIAE